jgi:hypothetical protein
MPYRGAQPLQTETRVPTHCFSLWEMGTEVYILSPTKLAFASANPKQVTDIEEFGGARSLLESPLNGSSQSAGRFDVAVEMKSGPH